MRRFQVLAPLLTALSAFPAPAPAAEVTAPDYASQVAPIFKKYCAGCHNDGDREGEFSLESYASLLKGPPRGPVFQAGNSATSRIIRQMTGATKPSMPPKDEPRPRAEEIAVIKAWIDAGAAGPQGPTPRSADPGGPGDCISHQRPPGDRARCLA